MYINALYCLRKQRSLSFTVKSTLRIEYKKKCGLAFLYLLIESPVIRLTRTQSYFWIQIKFLFLF